MRTSEERTSGAWTDGCETITDGGKEETALQATGNTATQRYSGSMRRTGSTHCAGEPVPDYRTQEPEEHNRTFPESQVEIRKKVERWKEKE